MGRSGTDSAGQYPAGLERKIAAPGKARATRTEGSVSQERPKTVVVALGKKASALVEVSLPEGRTSGTAFCVDKSGLFVTNAHVVENVFEEKADVRLVIDVGLDTERSVAAIVHRVDDYVDLALLKVDSESKLTTLELGQDETLSETAPVLAFGFPFGRGLKVGGEKYPNVSVISGRITTLHGPKERLEGVQFDGQINPGQSGGPVLDASGRVIGVAVATVPENRSTLRYL